VPGARRSSRSRHPSAAGSYRWRRPLLALRHQQHQQQQQAQQRIWWCSLLAVMMSSKMMTSCRAPVASACPAAQLQPASQRLYLASVGAPAPCKPASHQQRHRHQQASRCHPPLQRPLYRVKNAPLPALDTGSTRAAQAAMADVSSRQQQHQAQQVTWTWSLQCQAGLQQLQHHAGSSHEQQQRHHHQQQQQQQQQTQSFCLMTS
jgi:hypothetical protein